MKRIIATILALVASGAFAQTRPLPGGGGSSTITAATTATSGCTDGGFLYSLTNLIRCGANAINDGSTVTIGGGISGTAKALVVNNATSTGNPLEVQTNGVAKFTIPNDGISVMAAGWGFSHASNFALAIDNAASGMLFVNSPAVWIWTNSFGGVNSAALTASAIGISSTSSYTWSATGDSNGAKDTGFRRLAAGVSGATLGGADNGWIQNSAGELALNADYTNATATFSATALSATVISGRTYSFTLHLTFADSTAADGAQFDFNGGSAAATNFRVHCNSFNNAGAVNVLTNGAATALATAIQVTLAATTQMDITCQGSFVPSGNGTFIVRAAQTAHTAGTLTIHRGSWLTVRDARPL